MVFRIIVGVLSILVGLLIFLMLGSLGNNYEALSDTGFSGLYIFSGILLLASGALGIFLRQMKICRIVSSGLLFVGSLFPILVFVLANSAANMAGISFERLYPSMIRDLIQMSFLATVLTGVLSIVLFVQSFKKPKVAAAE